ncbi:hypothetical protein [Corallococcus sp. AB049A]|uniref:hypothetical protein n=1 Tax=Corallococcus sp. AB049A TaxID=2316721 RepID=UPI001F16D2D8|nr:hypothetical protein [Corallococcus sp. AB049A]
MKRIDRDPLRFDTFALFARFLQKEKLPLGEEEGLRRFVKKVRESAEEATKSEGFLFGQRTESLFEMVVASLGHVKFLKQEDLGDVFYQLPDDLQVPDFRVVFGDDVHAFVEVKNVHQVDAPLVRGAREVERLANYARLMKCELFFATFWSRWGMWTLVREQHLAREGNKRVLTLEKAFTLNEMALVGDLFVATRAPLRVCVETLPVSKGPAERRGKKGGKQPLKVQSVGFYTENGRITDPVELRIADFIVFYGRWPAGDVIIERDTDGGITAVEFSYAPPPEASHQEAQGCDGIGSLSEMLSRAFRDTTTRGDEVIATRADFVPGEYRDFIPPDFFFVKRRVLPLWVFRLAPKDTAAAD